MSLAESQEFFALNPDDLSGPAEQDRSRRGVGIQKLSIFVNIHKVKNDNRGGHSVLN